MSNKFPYELAQKLQDLRNDESDHKCHFDFSACLNKLCPELKDYLYDEYYDNFFDAYHGDEYTIVIEFWKHMQLKETPLMQALSEDLCPEKKSS